MRKIKGVNKVHIGESGMDIKEVKVIVEGLSRQIESLITTELIEPHAYN